MLVICNATSRADIGRASHIDGLRGYLALGVFVSHAASMRQFLQFGAGGWPPSSFFTSLGTAPVSLFFMITYFLFWGKAIKTRRRIDPYWLLASRIRRLAPLYLCTIPVLLFFVGVKSDWIIHTDLAALWAAIGRWLLIGAGGRPTINGVGNLYPQVWTLQYEWCFYAALPILTLLWRPPGGIAVCVAIISPLSTGSFRRSH